MLYQKRKKEERDEFIRQQEEDPSAWLKLRYKHQKSTKNIGLILVVTFILVPMMFVVLYMSGAGGGAFGGASAGGDGSGFGGSGSAGVGNGSGGFDDGYFDEPEFPDTSGQVIFNTDDDYSNPAALNPDGTSGAGSSGADEPGVPIIGTAYLTFDDGPARTLTPGILDILAEEGIIATFFILPVDGKDDILQRMIDEGHEIGNHSFSHNYESLYRSRISAFREDVLKARKWLEDRFGYSSKSFRFPGGSMTWNRDIRNARIDVLNELGYRYFDWHIDSGDAHPNQRDKGVQAITDNVLNDTHGREHVIILMHDFYGRETTLEALPIIIEGLKQQGYKFDIIRNMP